MYHYLDVATACLLTKSGDIPTDWEYHSTGYMPDDVDIKDWAIKRFPKAIKITCVSVPEPLPSPLDRFKIECNQQ